MRESFDTYWPLLLEVEGGFSNEDTDPGNWTGGKVGVGEKHGTKYGVAANTYPTLDIKNLTEADAKAIFLRDYMPKTGFDRLHAGVDVTVGDYGINSGPSRGVKALQKAVGADVDGLLGTDTLAREYIASPTAVIDAVSNERLSFLHGLTSMFGTYGVGWTRRVAKIQAMSIGLAVKVANYTPPMVDERMEAEAAKHTAAAKSNSDKAVGAGVGGGGAGAATTQVPDVTGLPPKTVAILIAVGAAIAVAYYLWHRHVSTVRAEAFTAAKGGIT